MPPPAKPCAATALRHGAAWGSIPLPPGYSADAASLKAMAKVARKCLEDLTRDSYLLGDSVEGLKVNALFKPKKIRPGSLIHSRVHVRDDVWKLQGRAVFDVKVRRRWWLFGPKELVCKASLQKTFKNSGLNPFTLAGRSRIKYKEQWFLQCMQRQLRQELGIYNTNEVGQTMLQPKA
jgi:hypothetical protein